jgi:hypothetical protein
MAGSLRYLIWCATGLIGSLVVFAGLAAFVDPYYMFGTPMFAGINLRHPRANEQMIASRTHLVARMRPRTLLLGNSRTEAGFDPSSAAWPTSMTPVFDAGLPGRGLDSATRVMEAALAGARLRHIIVAVEFLDTMGDDRRGSPVVDIRTPVPRLMQRLDYAHDWFEASLTIGALVDSIDTLLNQRSIAINTTRLDGSAELGEYADYMRHVGGAGIFEHKMAEYRARFATYTPPDFRDPARNATFVALLAVLDAATENDCTVDIIIYPYHAAVLDLIEQDALWPSFEAFKSVLVSLVWQRHPGTRIVDFSGYNAFTTEPPPTAGSGQAMRWYWEPGHFRTSLGDQIIERLYGEFGGFGRDLRPDTLADVLGAIRRERDVARAGPRI